MQVSLFELNDQYQTTYKGFPSSENCSLPVEARLKQSAEVQSKLNKCLWAAQELTRRQFNKGVTNTPEWNMGKLVWPNSRKILKTKPISTQHRRCLGPFSVCQQISKYAYNLTLPLSIKDIHPVFHVSVPRKPGPDSFMEEPQSEHKNFEVERETQWGAEDIVVGPRQHKKLKYLVTWEEFGT